VKNGVMAVCIALTVVASAWADELVFCSVRSGNWELWAVDVGSGRLRQITRTAAQERAPCWSPDKKRIAYANNLGELWIVNSDGSAAREIRTGQTQCGQPNWHPTEDSLLFVGFSSAEGDISRIYSMSVAGESARDPKLVVDRDALLQHPAWLPDGTALIYSLFTRGRFQEPIEELWVREVASGRDIEVTRTGVQNTNAVWSPDGTKVVFASTLGDNSDIWCMSSTAGHQLLRLTVYPGFDGDPCWSPRADRIAFVSTRDGTRNIWTMNADGTDKKPLTTGTADCSDPDW